VENSICNRRMDLRKLVHRKYPDLLNRLDLGDKSKINILDKLKLNRLIVDSYIEVYTSRPTTNEKISLAKDVVSTFPILKSAEGEGYVSV
jgi:hypothetical protein